MPAPETAPSPEPILRVASLTKQYRLRKGLFSQTQWLKAVDDVSFDLYPGETLGLVGESGSGKSTLGRMIVGLEEPTKGSIVFQNEELPNRPSARNKKLRKDIQIVFQDPYSSLNPRKRIGDVIAEPMLYHGLCHRREADRQVQQLLEMVGIPAAARHRYPHEFSGGQRQRIGIARALSVRPKLLVCDEPVSALDVSVQAQVLNLLKDLQQQLGLTVLFIAHGLGAVKYISDRIAVMYKGRIVELAATDAIFHNPRHPYTKALLAAYPIPDPSRRGLPKYKLKDEPEQQSTDNPGCPFAARCPAAGDICRQQLPPLQDRQGHRVACHFPDT